ncbi:hypothetical protein CEXT_61331 [Caerostris extrusa]|uniref:Uncharacterized protein n=1 Tax=Caerostris extrusa TaxID=172846 RepID=A0AAV4Q510_CAEEX|nr:hypothetical protein CEXT_61331 [Caerostris extrusa]
MRGNDSVHREFSCALVAFFSDDNESTLLVRSLSGSIRGGMNAMSSENISKFSKQMRFKVPTLIGSDGRRVTKSEIRQLIKSLQLASAEIHTYEGIQASA